MSRKSMKPRPTVRGAKKIVVARPALTEQVKSLLDDWKPKERLWIDLRALIGCEHRTRVPLRSDPAVTAFAIERTEEALDTWVASHPDYELVKVQVTDDAGISESCFPQSAARRSWIERSVHYLLVRRSHAAVHRS